MVEKLHGEIVVLRAQLGKKPSPERTKIEKEEPSFTHVAVDGAGKMNTTGAAADACAPVAAALDDASSSSADASVVDAGNDSPEASLASSNPLLSSFDAGEGTTVKTFPVEENAGGDRKATASLDAVSSLEPFRISSAAAGDAEGSASFETEVTSGDSARLEEGLPPSSEPSLPIRSQSSVSSSLETPEEGVLVFPVFAPPPLADVMLSPAQVEHPESAESGKPQSEQDDPSGTKPLAARSSDADEIKEPMVTLTVSATVDHGEDPEELKQDGTLPPTFDITTGILLTSFFPVKIPSGVVSAAVIGADSSDEDVRSDILCTH